MAATASRAASGNGLIPTSSDSRMPAVFDRIEDPVAAIDKLGEWFFSSGLFGLTTPAQGRVVAMACLCDRMNPMEIARRYHLIEGKLSMKAEAILAEFNERGGKHKIAERTSDAAEVELTAPGAATVKFRFTWEEAQQEPFPFAKDGNLKKNWASPRSRMQMLWARVVSDGVRALMPGVVVGTYTPEEIADFEPIAAASPQQSVEAIAARRAELAEIDRKAREAAEVIDVEAERTEGREGPAPPPAKTAAAAPQPTLCSMDQLQSLVVLGEECGLSRDELKAKLCEACSVSKPEEMTADQAEEMIRRLEQTLEKKRST